MYENSRARATRPDEAVKGNLLNAEREAKDDVQYAPAPLSGAGAWDPELAALGRALRRRRDER